MKQLLGLVEALDCFYCRQKLKQLNLSQKLTSTASLSQVNSRLKAVIVLTEVGQVQESVGLWIHEPSCWKGKRQRVSE